MVGLPAFCTPDLKNLHKNPNLWKNELQSLHISKYHKTLINVWSFHTGCWTSSMSQRSISGHYFLPAKKKKERISEELLNRFMIKLNKNHKSMQWTVVCIWYIYIFNEKIIKRYTYHHKRFFFFTVNRRGTKIFLFFISSQTFIFDLQWYWYFFGHSSSIHFHF